MPFLICGVKNHRGLLQGPLNSYHSLFFAPYTRLHSYGDVYTAAIMNLKHAGSIHYQKNRLEMEGEVCWLDEMEMDEGPDWPSDNFCPLQMEFSVRPCHLSCSVLFLMELSK